MFRTTVGLKSAINKASQQFMACPNMAYQLFHLPCPPEFILQFIWKNRILPSDVKAVTLCPKERSYDLSAASEVTSQH